MLNKTLYRGANFSSGGSPEVYDRYPWTLKDLRYTGKEIVFSAETDLYNGRAIQWSFDGKLFFISHRRTIIDGDTLSGGITCYEASTPFDITTLTKKDVLLLGDVTTRINTVTSMGMVHGMQIRDDGMKMFVNFRWETHSYTLSTPWDITTAIHDGGYDISQDVPWEEDPENPTEPELTSPFTHDLSINQEGTIIIIDQRPTRLVHQWEMTTPWDISTMEYEGYVETDFMPDNYTGRISSQGSRIRGVEFSPIGDRFFVTSPDYKSIAEYKCQSPFNVIGAELIRSDYIADRLISQCQSMEFGAGGFKLWITNMREGTLNEPTEGDEIPKMVTAVREYIL